MTRLPKIATWFLTVTAWLAACDGPSAELGVPADVGTDATIVTASPQASVEVVRSLMTDFQGGYVGRRGAVLGPGVPGWSKISQLTGQPAWHRPTKLDGRTAAWFDGIGATVGFPIGPEGPGLRTLSVWLYPVAPRQAASIFLDDKPLATIQLKSGWNRYDFRLPPSGLGEGEHRLRFWFRFSAVRRRVKTPAALGAIELRTANETGGPNTWFKVGEEEPLPFAGPPSRWSMGTLVPVDGRITARAHVESGGPVDFIVRVEEDRVGRLEIARVKVTRGQTVQVEASLKRWQGKLVRLSFGTDGMPDTLERAHWSHVKLTGRVLEPTRITPTRNLIVWSVEGMWSDDPHLGREGVRAATPNLDILHEQGAVALQAWTGGSGAREAHTRILGHGGDSSVAPTLLEAGFTTGLFTANPRFPKALRTGFQTRSVPSTRAARFAPDLVLSALDDWVYAHGKKRFFAYIDATAIGSTSRRGEGEPVKFGGGDDATQERLARSDYWLGRMLGILDRRGRLDNTTIIVVGMPSRSLRTAPQNPHTPKRLYGPLIVWHPGYVDGSQRRRDLDGVDLHDVGLTIGKLLGVPLPDHGTDRDLSASLFGVTDLWARPSFSRTPHGWVVGYGDWVYWPRAKLENRLWRRGPKGPKPVETGAYPIVVRTLRDRIATIPGDGRVDR